MLENQAFVLINLGRYAEARRLIDESIAITNRVGEQANLIHQVEEVKMAIALRREDQAADLINRYHVPVPDDAPLSIKVCRSLEARAQLALLKGDGAAAVRLASRARRAILECSER